MTACTKCEQLVDPVAVHCKSPTCTWCRACVSKKYEQCKLTPPPATP